MNMPKLEILREDDRSVFIEHKGREAVLSIHGYPHMYARLDFHEVKKLYWWLDDWMDEQRKNCMGGCKHERSGCQLHD